MNLNSKLLKMSFLVFAVAFLSSCSAANNENAAEAQEEKEIVEEQLTSPEADARAPIYVYADKSEKTPTPSEELILKLYAEPLLLPSGYARLVGVVSGRQNMALIEVGGKGLGVKIGDEVAGYRMIKILEGKVFLKKEKDKNG